MDKDLLVNFLSPEETALSADFLLNGYVVFDSESPQILESIHHHVTKITEAWLHKNQIDINSFQLSNSHDFVPNEKLNDLRLTLFAEINKIEDIRQRYFWLARQKLSTLVGNELAMQNKLNLSIQQPNDESSVLPILSDIWTGDSPFQVVLWAPLTDASNSNSMFFLPPNESREARQRVAAGEFKSMDQIGSEYQSLMVTMDVPYGKVLIFDSNCLHGNVLNETKSSRWSINCRFTGLLTPFTNPERRLGTYYLPITTRAATKIGLSILGTETAQA